MNGLDIIEADNPLKLPLGDYVNLADWSEKLLVDPLVDVDCRNLTEMQRDMLLGQIRQRYEPTSGAIEIVSTMQTMIWRRCIFSNPLLPQNRSRTMQVLAQRGKLVTNAPWLPAFADALMVTGCTGLGKSTTVMRYLARLQKYYEHPRRDDAEWTRHVQITFLVVPMPVHRGGLLYAILAAIDATIGTAYRVQYADHRRWPIEKLAIEVGIILAQHSVGILVIEEIQARNFGMSPYREEMLLFILRLLNFGIPVVLVGNPLGFLGMDEFSQDLNRLTENEPIHLMPPDLSDLDWSDGLGPGMWSHNVMPTSTPWSADVSAELYLCSTGFPGYTRKAVEGAQRLGMRSLGCQAVDLSYLKRYRETSKAFAANRNLIDGFRLKDPYKLMAFLDVPWETYGLEWGNISQEEIISASGEADQVTDPKLDEDSKAALRSVHRNIRASAAAQLTRNANKSKVNRAVALGLSGDDIRSATSSVLSAGLAALRQSLQDKQQGLPGTNAANH